MKKDNMSDILYSFLLARIDVCIPLRKKIAYVKQNNNDITMLWNFDCFTVKVHTYVSRGVQSDNSSVNIGHVYYNCLLA